MTIAGLTHPNPDDLDVMLVGPTGVSIVLMSDSGGETDLDNMFIRFVNPPFFGQSLPDDDPIDGQDYFPGDFDDGDDTFPDPAPDPGDETDFSVFVGTPVAGGWSLYVVDDSTGESGEIDEWAMEIGVTGTNYPSRARGVRPRHGDRRRRRRPRLHHRVRPTWTSCSSARRVSRPR